MAKRTAVTKPVVTTTTKPRIAERAAYATRGLIDTEGHGVVGNVSRGWDVYDDPTLVQSRKVAHERRTRELVAYFAAELAK